ncbi:MAG: helix-turn-helix domain-containing protein, partial [Cyanobacteria bacterium J06642_2]
MSLRRQPQQQRSQERLDRILEAAAEVFWEVGYEAATTHAIAAKANTAVGAIYRFFPDKLAIFHALEKQHYDRLAGIQSGLLSAQFINRPLRVLIRDIVETFAQYFQDPAPRVVYIQYFVNPDMFVYFDAEY